MVLAIDAQKASSNCTYTETTKQGISGILKINIFETDVISIYLPFRFFKQMHEQIRRSFELISLDERRNNCLSQVLVLLSVVEAPALFGVIDEILPNGALFA